MNFSTESHLEHSSAPPQSDETHLNQATNNQKDLKKTTVYLARLVQVAQEGLLLGRREALVDLEQLQLAALLVAPRGVARADKFTFSSESEHFPGLL